MPTKRQATSSRGVRGRLRSLDNMSNNARSIDDRRSPLNTAIVARRLFAGTTIVARPWSLSLNRTQVAYLSIFPVLKAVVFAVSLSVSSYKVKNSE
ncbi:hypothetical protein DPMN_178605 [Dreissena polymorpha]|uniref:Uncharacterized protein n=1 Tax=Dreissena polymorpha TaxID=45954 RepID=A0A9D4IMS1_DREPO|nr:hypothetical protein DPMN_178605 [Dreissena polymorpha]